MTMPLKSEKASHVRDMFASIAPTYDTTNRVLTAGVDEAWRRRALRELGATAGGRVLDLCCGTGDLSFGVLRADRAAAVAGVDFCEPMLAGARERARREDPGHRAEFICGDVMALPFGDDTFDGATMGFSMRNVVDITATLRETLRVLRPGARFVNLDISKAPNPLARALFETYFYKLVPVIGRAVSGSKSAYSYLPQSLTNYPDADALAQRFCDAGFVGVRYVRLCMGAIALHVGTKPA